jgi:NAD(P)-dependent dehydrogenase (short-subunit alcohol dehydrogenase family)
VTAFKPLEDVTVNDINLTYDISVTGFLIGVQRSVDLMEDGGRIIAVSGNDTHTFMPLHGLLASAKSALETLVRQLAVEQAENDIKVNAVNPGILDKENYYTTVSDETEEAIADLTERTPKQDAVPLESAAEAIVTFAEPRHEWVTGEVLHVDGGLIAR